MNAIRAASRQRAEEQGSGSTDNNHKTDAGSVGKGVCLPVCTTVPNNHNININEESSRSNREVLHERKKKKNKPGAQHVLHAEAVQSIRTPNHLSPQQVSFSVTAECHMWGLWKQHILGHTKGGQHLASAGFQPPKLLKNNKDKVHPNNSH